MNNMKIINVLRHAKSSWDNPSLKDIERPLNKRGIKSCKVMAPEILATGCNFKNIFVSPAVRTQQTITKISKNLPKTEIKWKTKKSFYYMNDLNLFKWCRKLSDDFNEIMIVGHNPTMTYFSDYLSKTSIHHLPTCAFVRLELNINNWQDLAANSANLTAFLKPKMFVD